MNDPNSIENGLAPAADAAWSAAPSPTAVPPHGMAPGIDENRLIQVRLGIASGLFMSLSWKHEPTAQHALRVALHCSAWAKIIGLPIEQHDEIEVAALLHDVGKIGVPDNILCKPGLLTPQESLVMDSHWIMGRQILESCLANPAILEIIDHTRAWYNGQRSPTGLSGDKLPIGARMLAIVDAFDSMTTDHAYRRAMPRARALEELFHFAGTQFDPTLVKIFARLYEQDHRQFAEAVAQRWLHSLDAGGSQEFFRRGELPFRASEQGPEVLYQQKLLDNMYDAVVFIDAAGKVLLWNRGAERLTGIAGPSMHQRLFTPSVLKLRDEHGELIPDHDCPIRLAIQNGVQWLRRLKIAGRGGRDLAVDAHAIPVATSDGVTQGLTLLLHDVSPEISLEARCQNLHELATRDPLTQVANRAEFDRVHESFLAAHMESQRPCAILMADIDRFKRINDTFGHPAGDEVIQAFARLLKTSCRPGDLVARYGGEEFVMLCADCDLPSAARRAEELRKAFAQVKHRGMNDDTATASFGVTEVQPGDTPDIFLRRADRALLQAKETGRDRVVQIGSGDEGDEGSFAAEAPPPRKRLPPGLLLEMQLLSESPIDRNLEKLHGFVADHHAQVVSVGEKQVTLRVEGLKGGPLLRRGSDRAIRLLVTLLFEETDNRLADTNAKASRKRTLITVQIKPVRSRERRQLDAFERARSVLVSLRSYLMAVDATPMPEFEPDDAPSLGAWLGQWFGGRPKAPAK